jgi:hypothetical protein
MHEVSGMDGGMVLGRLTETGASIATNESLHKELASVRVLSPIRHREEKGLVVFEREVFIVKGSAVD